MIYAPSKHTFILLNEHKRFIVAIMYNCACYETELFMPNQTEKQLNWICQCCWVGINGYVSVDLFSRAGRFRRKAEHLAQLFLQPFVEKKNKRGGTIASPKMLPNENVRTQGQKSDCSSC